jgi:hypothetical protein
MGWFGGKSSHKREVGAAYRVVHNLFDATTEGKSRAPLVLRFELPDSRFRYLVFCLTTAQAGCAHRMKNPDAILNELFHVIVLGCLNVDPAFYFGGPILPQQAANQGGQYLQDYLERWSAWVDIVQGSNPSAATSIVAGMLRSTESSRVPTDGDARRLWPLATWIEGSLEPMAEAFTDMAR